MADAPNATVVAITKATVIELNALLATHGPFSVFCKITNRSNMMSGVAHGTITEFFEHAPDKVFRVGVRIHFEGNEYKTPSSAGSAMTKRVRAAIGTESGAPGGTFDGWNRLWMLFKGDLYGTPEMAGKWVKIRLGQFVTRDMREASQSFALPLPSLVVEANSVHLAISCTPEGESIIIISPNSDGGAPAGGGGSRNKRKRDNNGGGGGGGGKELMATARISIPTNAAMTKRLRSIPPRLQTMMTALFLLYNVDTIDEALSRVAAGEHTEKSLQDLLSLEFDEVHELLRTAKLVINKTAAATTTL